MQATQNLRIASKYLVEQRTFFSTSQFTLLLQQNELLKLVMEKDNKQASRETFPWQMLLDVHASDRNQMELTLEILPEMSQMMRVKDRMQLVQSGKQLNTVQMVFYCAERDRLVTELKHIIHVKNNGGKPQLIERCKFQTEIESEVAAKAPSHTIGFSRLNQLSGPTAVASKRKPRPCLIRLHPTAIQVITSINMQRDNNEKASGGRGQNSGLLMQSPNMMGSLLVSGIGHGNPERMTMDLESRVLMGSEEDDARMFETKQQDLFLETDDNAQDDRDDQRAEQELDQYNQLTIEDQPADFLGFGANQGEGKNMGDDRGLGGFDTGKNPAAENFTYHGLANNYGIAEKFGQLRQHLIYLSELKDVLTQGATLVLIKQSQEIEKFNFVNEEQVQTFTKQLMFNQADVLKCPLVIHTIDPRDDLRQKIPFLNWPKDAQKSTCFSVQVSVVTSDNSFVTNSFIELDQTHIYEVDGAS